MKLFLAIFLAVILVFVCVQAYNLHRQTGDLAEKTSELNAEAKVLGDDNQHYQEDIEYYSRPENIGKESLKYNRKKPGEDLYILVPPQNASTSQ